MSQEPNLTPEQQLAAIGNAQNQMNAALAYGAKLMGWYCILLALVIGALATLLQIYSPDENMTGFVVLMALYGVAIVVLTFAYRKLHRSMPHGFSKKYLRGFIATIVLYAISVALLPLRPDAMIISIIIGLVVAAPLAITGLKMVSK